MGKVLIIQKGLTCLRNWKTNVARASCAGEIHVHDMTLKKYLGHLMLFLFSHVRE